MRAADRASRIAVVLGWMALLTYWSSQGNLPIDQPAIAVPLHGFQHRVAHLIAFGGLGLLARWAFDGLPRSALLAVALTSAFGGSDEWHQSFTPGRRPAVDDWMTDTAAAAIAIYVWGRLSTMGWQPVVRSVAPGVVIALFAVGVGLALKPSLPTTAPLNRAAVRGMTNQVAHSAGDLARSTRDAARHLRAQVG